MDKAIAAVGKNTYQGYRLREKYEIVYKPDDQKKEEKEKKIKEEQEEVDSENKSMLINLPPTFTLLFLSSLSNVFVEMEKQVALVRFIATRAKVAGKYSSSLRLFTPLFFPSPLTFVSLIVSSAYKNWNPTFDTPKPNDPLEGPHISILKFCFVLFCFVLFCFVLFCFVLFCFVLFCFVFVLFYIFSFLKKDR